MQLDSLPWAPVRGNPVAHNGVPFTHIATVGPITVWRDPYSTIFWIKTTKAPFTPANYYRHWPDLDPFAAQAILYHLLEE